MFWRMRLDYLHSAVRHRLSLNMERDGILSLPYWEKMAWQSPIAETIKGRKRDDRQHARDSFTSQYGVPGNYVGR
ncbi:MAG: hypothetical protein A4E65_00101 [Syntrophorhabdus sp. PtaU1.Bin153]|nr:MAG: hypothetical protein A4E65_00101 [Syntrophorhabdus sp. PtaU1.Bin153]